MEESNARNARQHRLVCAELFWAAGVDARGLAADVVLDARELLDEEFRIASTRPNRVDETLRGLLLDAGGREADPDQMTEESTPQQRWPLLETTQVDIRHAVLTRAQAAYLLDDLDEHKEMVAVVLSQVRLDHPRPAKAGAITFPQDGRLYRETRVSMTPIPIERKLTSLEASFLIELLEADRPAHVEFVRSVLIERGGEDNSRQKGEPRPRQAAPSRPRAQVELARPTDLRSVTLVDLGDDYGLALPSWIATRVSPEDLFDALPTDDGILVRLLAPCPWLEPPTRPHSASLREVDGRWHLLVPGPLAERVPPGTEFVLSPTEDGALYRRLEDQPSPDEDADRSG